MTTPEQPVVAPQGRRQLPLTPVGSRPAPRLPGQSELVQSPISRRMTQAFGVMAKPTGAACNLDCSYCFFLSKEVLWEGSNQRMGSEALRHYLTTYLASEPDGEVVLAWQGGEPTMRGLDFFREAVALTNELARPRQRVQHAIQTNGTLLTDEWCEFFAQTGFLVGLSVDGPEHLHDEHRVNKAGRGTYRQVIRGWDLLRKHRVDTNILCTVNAVNADHPLEVYRHFRDDLGAEFIQFIPIVERVAQGQEALAENNWRDEQGHYVLYEQDGDQVTSRTVRPAQWGDFLTAIYDEWVARDVGQVFVQHFDVMLSALFGQYTLCVHSPECGAALAMEHNGDVYSCDHFVEPQYRLGNIFTETFADMLESPQQREFGRSKRTALTQQCQGCPVRWVCHGGCPKDRFMLSRDGEPGQNWLCEGYYSFFSHATPTIEVMGRLVQSGRPAAQVMELVARQSGSTDAKGSDRG